MLRSTTLLTGRASRLAAGMVALTFITPLLGCGRQPNTYAGSPPPNNAPRQQNTNPIDRMSTGQKVAVLAGAAALYYLYKKHQNVKGTGASGQYYRSKNGGVYYRDQNGNPVWVQPPAGGIQVPAHEASRYEQEARQYGFRDTAPTGSAF